MPRLPRINLEGAIHYVISRAPRNEAVFKDKADTHMYLELLTKYKTEYKFKLFSYCLEPDKVQLLIETGDGATISEIMHDLNSLYTKYFNGRYHQKGHLFESRFKSVLVEKAEHLLEVTRYIHQSPGEGFADFPHSSFHNYRVVEAGGQSFDMADEIREVIGFLKAKDDPNAYEKYCLALDPDHGRQLEKKLNRGGILGSDAFVAAVRNRVQEHAEELKEKAHPKVNRTLIVMAGAAVLVAFPTALFLYISRASLENKYENLLRAKEAEFAEKTKFENVSPLALTELDGTEWEVELVSLPADQAKEAVKDRIRFQNGRFYSANLQTQMFQDGTYFLVPKGNGVFSWQTALSNAKGDTVGWRGEWRADAMKGLMSLNRKGESPRDFSFFSLKWSYVKNEKTRAL